MSGQIDVGWAVIPFGVEAVDQGQIRVIAKASDIPSFRDQTIRLITTNGDTLKNKREVLGRYLQAYRETVNWMYADAAVLKIYSDFAKVSEPVSRRMRDDLMPKEDLNPDRLSGLDGLMADAVSFKYISAALSKEQVGELFLIPYK
jgi:NitT/TauT family transport system substrate-binding protein